MTSPPESEYVPNRCPLPYDDMDVRKCPGTMPGGYLVTVVLVAG